MGGNSRAVGIKLNQFNLKQVQKTLLFGLKPNSFKVISINMNWLMLNLIKPVLKKKKKKLNGKCLDEKPYRINLN